MNIRELLIKIGVDAKGVPQEIDKVDNKTEKLKNNFLELGTILKTVFAAATIRELINMADGMQNLQSRVGAATGDLAGANAQLNDLNNHANAARMNINDYADSWAKFQVGMGRLGYQTSDTTQLVDGLSAAFRVNGTAGATAAGALFQLTQSISGGMVQMEELNSLADAAGPLYVSMAEEIGGTTTAFKKMVSDGKVTSKMLADSIIKQTKKYIEQLREMPLTLGDVWTVVTNDTKVGINNLNSATLTISRTAKQLLTVWDDLKRRASELTDALGGPDGMLQTIKNMITPLATVIGLFYAFKTFAFLASPIGMVLMLAAAVGALYDDYRTWKEGGVSLIDWSKWEPGIQAALKGIGWLIDKFKELTGSTSDIEAGFSALALFIGTTWAVKFAAAVASAFNLAGLAARKTPLGAIILGSAALGEVVFNAADDFSKKKWGEETTGSGLTERRKGSVADSIFNAGGAVVDYLKGTGVRWNTNSPGYEPKPDNGGKTAAPGQPATDNNNTNPNILGYVPPPAERTTPAGTTQQTVNAPVTANITINQQPGEAPQVVADKVVDNLHQLQKMSGIGAYSLQDVNGDVK